MFPRYEHGLRVEVSEDGSNVLMTLDSDHAEELARFISLLAVERDGDDAWFKLAKGTAHDTWIGAMLRLMACSQNLHRGPERAQGVSWPRQRAQHR